LSAEGAGPAAGLALTGMFYVNVNVSDMDRSVNFYQRLGFQKQLDAEVTDPAVAVGLGLPAFTVRAVFMNLPDAPDGAPLLDLVQFRDPPPVGPTYPILNHLGICRLAYTVADLDGACAELDRLGVAYHDGRGQVRFAGSDSWHHARPRGFVTFRDPDGTFIQLVATVPEHATVASAGPTAADSPDRS
jgi:catechol 2,3-dioxygenase-like lactoylglutathione lyase family enzyme